METSKARTDHKRSYCRGSTTGVGQRENCHSVDRGEGEERRNRHFFPAATILTGSDPLCGYFIAMKTFC